MQNQAWDDGAPAQSSYRAGRRPRGMWVVNALAGSLLALGVVATLQAGMQPSADERSQHPVAFYGNPAAGVRLLADYPPEPGDLATYQVLPAGPKAANAEASAARVAAESSMAQLSVAAQTLREEAVRVTIEQWVAAWSLHDVAGYLAAYGKDFTPDNGMARSDWERTRRQRLTGRGAIYIALRDIEIALDGPDKASARFLQDYRSGSYQELATPKTLALIMEDGAWRIIAEKSGQ